MKLTHFVPQTEEQSSGYAYTVPRTCEALASIGHSVSLITVDGSVQVFDEGLVVDQRKKYTERKAVRGMELQSMEKMSGISGNLRRVAIEASTNSDILHSHSLWRMTNIYPAWAAKKRSKRFVISPRGTLNRHALSGRSLTKTVFDALLQRGALQSAALFHATSEAEYHDIRESGFHVPVAIIPNGVDIPELRSCKPSKKRTLLYVGRIHSIKGLEIFFDSWRGLHDELHDWQIRIVGPIDSEYSRLLRKKTIERQLPRIEFVGEKSGPDRDFEYQQADIVVLPSYSENFGMVVAEALANATPVITTTGTPWAELHVKECGWWVKRTPDHFSNALLQACKMNRFALSELGHRGRSWMIDEYSWEKVAQDMTSAYRWLLSRNEQPDFVRVN
jgi:glycosyltransferase involved in cell wall biosynthesis